MARPTFLLLSLVCLGLAPAPFLEKPKPRADLDRMQGSWQWDASTELRIQGNNYAYYRNGAVAIAYTITINEKASPRQYDIKGVGKFASRHYHGIYKIEGGQLTLCAIVANRPRPTTFSLPSGGEYKVLRRTRR